MFFFHCIVLDEVSIVILILRNLKISHSRKFYCSQNSMSVVLVMMNHVKAFDVFILLLRGHLCYSSKIKVGIF